MDKTDLLLAAIENLRRDVDGLRMELREYADRTVENTNDIKWVKGFARIGVTVIAAVVSAATSILIKLTIK